MQIPEKTPLNRRFLSYIIIVLLCLTFGGDGSAETDMGEVLHEEAYTQPSVTNQDDDAKLYPVPPPLVYQSLYPCQACHQSNIRGVNSQLEEGNDFLGTYLRLPDPEPRILVRMHRDINIDHADWMWCLNCHSTNERNYLILMTGEQIPFEKSYRLCGQCHGTILRDWRIGIHGRRAGNWDGEKMYLLCTHCHDPHQPRFRKLPGMDSPEPPSFGRWEKIKGHE